MRSKEEILKSKKEPFFYVDDNSVDGDVNGVYDAMEEYAKEMCVEFANWMYGRCVETLPVFRKEDDMWLTDIDKTVKDSEQLFNQFLQEIKQDK